MTTKQILVLDRRDATIGNSISTRAEKHGDENVPAKDITISCNLNRNELCSLLREELAAEAFFNQRQDGYHEPLFGGKLEPIKLVGKFEDCDMTVLVGIDLVPIKLANVVIANVRMDPQSGGMTNIKFTAQYRPHESDDVAELDNWLNQGCKLELAFGKLAERQQKQPELALNAPETLDDAIAEDEAEQAEADSVEEQNRKDIAAIAGEIPDDDEADEAESEEDESEDPESDDEAGDDDEPETAPLEKAASARKPKKKKRVRPSRSKAAKAARDMEAMH